MSSEIYPWAYRFVTAVFLLLGMAFLASSASIIHEFGVVDGLAMLIAHSHLFLFFPILGLLALYAFYLPSVVFTDLYWKQIDMPLGRVRFVGGVLFAIGLSIYLAGVLHNSTLRGVWEISPTALEQDGKVAGGQSKPIKTVLADVMHEGNQRTSISQFARNCLRDQKVEKPASDDLLRYCVPSGTMLKADDCCRVQYAFREHVANQWRNSATRSRAADYDRLLLPFKVFFIIVLLFIGCMLVLWRHKLRKLYDAELPAVEMGVMVGALAMLVWPLMDYGYQQTSDVMFGRDYANVNFRMSLVIAPWAALLLLYFVDFGKDSGRVTQISTIVGGAVAVLRYQEINDLSARILGSGASWWHFLGLVLLAIGGVYWLRRPIPSKGHDGPMT